MLRRHQRHRGLRLADDGLADGDLAFLQPSRLDLPVRKSLAKGMLAEIEGRSMNVNVGGVPGWSSMNAMREKALRIAVAIERFGPSTKHFLTLAGASAMTGSILRRNRDGWFERVDGVYTLTDKGRLALLENQLLAGSIRRALSRLPIAN